jgi:hypothetical protein
MPLAFLALAIMPDRIGMHCRGPHRVQRFGHHQLAIQVLGADILRRTIFRLTRSMI